MATFTQEEIDQIKSKGNQVSTEAHGDFESYKQKLVIGFAVMMIRTVQ